MRNIRLINKLCPGDCLVMTAAIECLHKQHPGEFQTDIQTSCDDIFKNNPHVKTLENAQEIEMNYPLVNFCNQRPVHFIKGYCDYLAESLGVPIDTHTNRPHIYLSSEEKAWMSQVQEMVGRPIKYWVINAGIKSDYTCKSWGHFNYQNLVDLLYGKIQFVQIGESNHNHEPLENVINLIGKTDARQLMRLCWHAQGGVGPITFIQHIFAAYQKPYVALLGGREPLQWENYPTQTTMSTLGMLPCCQFTGCWKSRVVPLGDNDQKDQNLCELPVIGVETIPKCMAMIEPTDVASSILKYYEGGVLRF